MAMLNYSKIILEKVSFDPELFEKELIKSMEFIEKEELPKLKAWCNQNFRHIYPSLLEKVFRERETIHQRN